MLSVLDNRGSCEMYDLKLGVDRFTVATAMYKTKWIPEFGKFTLSPLFPLSLSSGPDLYFTHLFLSSLS